MLATDLIDAASAPAGDPPRPPGGDAEWWPDPDKTTGQAPPPLEVHYLSRLTYGFAPGEPERVAAMGIGAFVEEQLAPETIDDSAVSQAIAARFPDLSLTAAQINEFRQSDPARFNRHATELKLATLYRALYSRRQLYERMVEFWSDHFSIYHLQNEGRVLKTIDDREVIRPNALGRFQQLLNASARSPAMLYYLDNVSNVRTGPNENYARELMELHSLSVTGGYTQRDVVEVARAFTGWTYQRGRNGYGTFFVNANQHDTGAKVVLGRELPAGQSGLADGQAVLDLLGDHPATAQFIAFKLCRRFVADSPPAALVARVAATFTATDGDIRALLRTILLSDEFRAATDQKLKRPMDFVLAALRALPLRVEISGLQSLLFTYLRPLAHSPFDWEPPNGYPDVAGAWTNTNGFLYRWNAASAIVLGRVRGVSPRFADLVRRLNLRTPRQAVDAMVARLLRRQMNAADYQYVLDYAANGANPDVAIGFNAQFNLVPRVAALLLASPYFQWR